MLRAQRLVLVGVEVVFCDRDIRKEYVMKGLGVVLMTLVASCGFAAGEQPDIFTAIGEGDVAKVQEMARTNQLDKIDATGRSPLMVAAGSGKLAIVKVLLQEEADIDFRDKYGFTVIDQLESILRRSGTNMQATAETLRKQGVSEAAISNLVASSAVPGNPSEKDVQQIKAVLKHLKEVKAAQEKEKKEAEKAANSDEKK